MPTTAGDAKKLRPSGVAVHTSFGRDGLGVHYALYVDQFTTGTGVWLREHIGVVKALNYGTLVIEALVPLLLLSPWRTGWTRLAGAALAIPMHIGMMATLEVGLFSWIMMVWWLALLPAGVWDRVERLVKRYARKYKPPKRTGPDPARTICSSREAKATVGIAAIFCAWTRLACAARRLRNAVSAASRASRVSVINRAFSIAITA